MIKLPYQHWHTLEEIFDKEFDSDLPERENAEIFVINEAGKRKGFILAEDIKMIGQIYVYPDFRNVGNTARDMVKFMVERYKGIPVGTLASEPRFESLYKRLGMQKIEGSLFRKN